MTRGKRIGWSIGGVVVIAALGLGARAATGVLVSASDAIPTGTVTRGTLKADLVTTGADVDRWLDIAQAFAGQPGEGRAPR